MIPIDIGLYIEGRHVALATFDLQGKSLSRYYINTFRSIISIRGESGKIFKRAKRNAGNAGILYARSFASTIFIVHSREKHVAVSNSLTGIVVHSYPARDISFYRHIDHVV